MRVSGTMRTLRGKLGNHDAKKRDQKLKGCPCVASRTLAREDRAQHQSWQKWAADKDEHSKPTAWWPWLWPQWHAW